MRATISRQLRCPRRSDRAHGTLFDSNEKLQARRKHIHGAVGRPEEIAALVCFLLSDEAGWQTGSVYRADGGIRRLSGR